MQKLQSMWWLLQFINQNIKIKNKEDYIWYKGSTSFTQNWHSFLSSYNNAYRFIIYIIFNNIFIKINE